MKELQNIEVRMFMSSERNEGFHTKGYMFRKEEIYRIIVGSSNMTKSALTTNHEWNTRIVSTEQGEYAKDILKEFNALWDSPQTFLYEEFIDQYSELYTKNQIIKKQREVALQEKVTSLVAYRLQPNSMQVGFINNLRKIYEAGEDKALLISATGERVILMTGEKSLIIRVWGLSFLFCKTI